MKKLITFYLLILISILCGFTGQKKELKITYLANCGFLFSASDRNATSDR